MAKIARLLAGLLLVALLAAGFYIFFGEKFRPVGDTGLFRSAQPTPEQLERRVREQGLRAVLNLRGPNPAEPWYRGEKERAAQLGIAHRDIALSARRLPQRETLRELVAALDTLPRPLLVHCQHGNDRSGLAALLARLLAGDTLDGAAEEISPFRGVLYPDTVGRQFLAQYRGWLDTQGVEHEPGRLRRFVEQGYLDADGNLRFLVEFVNAHPLDPRHPPELRLTHAAPLAIEGWAFDPESPLPLRSIRLLLGESPLGQATLHLPRPDVSSYYGLTGRMDTGWRLDRAVPSDLAGCMPLRIEIETAAGRRWRSEPLAELCLEE